MSHFRWVKNGRAVERVKCRLLDTTRVDARATIGMVNAENTVAKATVVALPSGSPDVAGSIV